VHIDDIVRVSSKHHHKISKICDSLYQQFGITAFMFQVVDNDGNYYVIRSNVNWEEYMLNNKLYYYNPSLIHPNHYQSGTLYIPSYQNEEFNHIKYAANNLFDMYHSLLIINKTAFGCEFAEFATSRQNQRIINTYISKLNVLKYFVKEFKDEHYYLIDEAQDYQVDLKELRGESFFKTSNIFSITPDEPYKEQFATENVNLSDFNKREQDCLKHISLGKTNKEIARILHLSPRTIDDYVIKFKENFGCQHKRELVGLLKS